MLRSWAWRLLNAVQLLILSGWTACGICVALLVSVVTGSAAISLAMARRVWAPGLLAGIGIRLRVVGREHIEPGTPVVFVANHQSNLDVPVLYAALPVDLRFLVKAEFGNVPFLGWYVRAMGMVLVDRKHRASARASLARVAELLRSGESLAAFPEGTRGVGGSLKPFKMGVFAVAIETGTPIVPVAIHGTGEAWPPHTLTGRPGKVLVEIGEPLDTTGLGPGDRLELSQRARERVAALLDSASPNLSRTQAAPSQVALEAGVESSPLEDWS